jgi:biopolymer transport protein ExbB
MHRHDVPTGRGARRASIALVSALALCAAASAQEAPRTQDPPAARGGFDSAAAGVRQQLEASLAELSALRERIAGEKVPMGRELSGLEAELSQVRLEFQQKTRLLDSRALNLSNLNAEIKARKDEAAYLSNLLSEYGRNFESRLHITELKRYEAPLSTAKLAVENTGLAEEEVYAAQLALLRTSIERLEDDLGGTRFEGSAVDGDGLVKKGRFVLVGPVALFLSEDGEDVGTVEQRLGSLEPAIVPFGLPEDAQAARELVSSGVGQLPLDPTLGDAHKIEAIEETFIEHAQKGGPVMVPIVALAGAAFLVALLKWLSLSLVRRPSRKQVERLLEAVANQDEEDAAARARAMPGPAGKMLAAGVDHIREPRELIEEVMYEQVLTTRYSVQGYLPFIAISAAAAPLLGLLGTVTGIIDTFKLITVFGSGDVKSLSGGISQALITTEFGLIVAIPSLLMHAYLLRKAKSITTNMEALAVRFANEVAKHPFRRGQRVAPDVVVEGIATPAVGGSAPDPDLIRAQVTEILNELLAPLANGQDDQPRSRLHGARSN